MLRRNFFTAAIGSVAALFAGKAAKAESVEPITGQLMTYDAWLRAANGGPLKSFADLDENTKWTMKTRTPLELSGEKCEVALSVPASANVYQKVFQDGDCVCVTTYIAPKGKKVNARLRAAMLHTSESPAMYETILDVNGTLVRITTLGVTGMHGIGADSLNGPSASINIVSNAIRPCLPRSTVSYRLLPGTAFEA